MKKEVSAGGIIVRKRRGIWEVLVIEDVNGERTFPKGKIETGEAPKEAAVREITEEVGLTNLMYVNKLTPLRYLYTRDGLVDKTVYFFVFRYDGKETPVGQAEEGIQNPTWMPIDAAITRIGYPKSNQPLLRDTVMLLNQL